MIEHVNYPDNGAENMLNTPPKRGVLVMTLDYI